jgi:hypothetical protein
MLKIIIRERTHVPPFNEPARDLRILNKPLWLHQRDILAPYCKTEQEVGSFAETPEFKGEALVYRDNLFFDQGLLETFLKEAHRTGGACRTIKQLLLMPSPCKMESGGRAMFT